MLIKTQPNWEEYYSTLKRIPKRMKKTAQFIVEAIPDFQKRSFEQIIDLGCGVGRHSILLASAGFQVVGVDISRNALKMARNWAQNRKLKNVALVRATMTNIPLSNGSSDAVISVSVIHHAMKNDLLTTVNEVHRILRKNGTFLANVASTRDPRYRTGKMLEKNTYWILEAYEERNFGELHHFSTKHQVTQLLHNFTYVQVTAAKEKPNYWEILASK